MKKNKIVNATQASIRVAKAVIKRKDLIVSEEERDRRLSICRSCPEGYWNENGNMGMGECTHSKCGCTRIKHKLTTEKCPIGLW